MSGHCIYGSNYSLVCVVWWVESRKEKAGWRTRVPCETCCIALQVLRYSGEYRLILSSVR